MLIYLKFLHCDDLQFEQKKNKSDSSCRLEELNSKSSLSLKMQYDRNQFKKDFKGEACFESNACACRNEGDEVLSLHTLKVDSNIEFFR